jgi:hypothetical protein
MSKKYFLRWTFFHDNQLLSSSVFLGVVCALLDEPFFGFSDGLVRFIYSGGRMSIDRLAIN